jgi:hypothetical protein
MEHKVYFTHPPCRRLSGPPYSDGRPNPSTEGCLPRAPGNALIQSNAAHRVLEDLRAQRAHRSGEKPLAQFLVAWP